jgi:sugar phosphate isomerase/epimerase
MRLGGPIFEPYCGPEEWVAAVRKQGYRAAFCPVGNDASPDVIRAYEAAAAAADIVIAEVGAWSNPLSPDDSIRLPALEGCKKQLALADEIGARCCVNIAGSRGAKWDGPDATDLTDDTFDLIVDCVRDIIDAVRPSRTFYTLETMPWMYPDSPDSYVELIAAVDRDRFAVHLDPMNLICSPRRYFGNAHLIRECFGKLGPHIKSCHGKDILLHEGFVVHMDEVRPGLGALDYRAFLTELERCAPEAPLMLEHLPNAAEYELAAEHVRAVAAEVGVALA